MRKGDAASAAPKSLGSAPRPPRPAALAGTAAASLSLVFPPLAGRI